MSPHTVTGHRTGVTLGSAARTSRAISQSAWRFFFFFWKREVKVEEVVWSVAVLFFVDRRHRHQPSFLFFFSFIPPPYLDLRLRQRAAPQQPLDLRVELRARRCVRQGWRGRHSFFSLERERRWPLSSLSRSLSQLDSEAHTPSICRAPGSGGSASECPVRLALKTSEGRL